MIPTFSLHEETDALWHPMMASIQEVIRSGQFIQGPNVKAFEREAAEYLGVKFAIGVNSGTDALTIALRAAGVRPGDEVITSPFSFFATVEAIHQAGAVPVFADIDPRTFAIDADAAVAAVSPKTRAIVPVHLFGQSADLEPLLRLAARHRIKVVEDTAQAFGGTYKGRQLGTWGDAGCYSFFPSKNLGAYGDGGLIATNDAELAETARMLGAHGSKTKYYNEQVGYNSRLDEIQSAVLRIKLPHIDEWNAQRREAAAYYDRRLQDIPGIVVPFRSANARHVYNQYTIRVLHGRRDEVRRKLAERGVSTAVYYPVPLHKLPVYADGGGKGATHAKPEAEAACAEVLSIPIWPHIRQSEQDEVADRIREAVQ